MVVLVTCKNEEDPIKNEGARVLTTLNINFSDAEGQLTLHPFPHPNDVSDKIWLQSAHWLRRYLGHIHRRQLDGYTISSPCEPSAQVS